jgi:hypothetical protein
MSAIQHHIRLRRANVALHYVRAHAGNQENDEADALAKEGTRKAFEEEVIGWLDIPHRAELSNGDKDGPCRISTTLPAPPKKEDAGRVRRGNPEKDIHRGRAGRRGAQRWFLEKLRKAGINSGQLRYA